MEVVLAAVWSYNPQLEKARWPITDALFPEILTTKRAKDAIEGIDAVAEAYPEAVAALNNRFDRPQVIHRAHVRAILNIKPMN